MIQSQHDSLVLRVCQKTWVEAQHSVQFVANRLGSEVFKQVFVTHLNAVIAAVKRTLKPINCDGGEREEVLEEDLERNVTLCLPKIGKLLYYLYLVANKGSKSRGVGGLTHLIVAAGGGFEVSQAAILLSIN